MAKRRSTEPIPAFPADIDRNAFGHWLSGFTDGEGCFYLGVQPRPNGAFDPQSRFQIALRADDLPILRQIQAFLTCGRLYAKVSRRRREGNPITVLCVFKTEELASVIVPFFERYPLRAKKTRDFAIWRQGVELMHDILLRRTRGGKDRKGRWIDSWSEKERTSFRTLVAALKNQRHYRPAPISC